MKTYTKFGVSALALGLLGMPGLGRAQEPRTPEQEHRAQDLNNLPNPMEALRNLENTGKMAFMMADVNHDGQVSQQEAIDVNNMVVGAWFFRADADGNGAVTQEEAKAVTDKYLDQNPWLRYVVQSLEAQAKQKNGQDSTLANPILGMWGLIDTNNDKQIQATELRQIVQTFTQSYFAAADTNRDGKMSLSEVNASVVGGVRSIAQGIFQEADTDNNGQLSRAEYDKAVVEPANVVFQIIDLNHDGQISPQEAQRTERALIQQVRLMQLPDPANSPTNLLESGKLPSEVAPVPTFATPRTGQSQNRPQSAPAAGQPAAPAAPR